MKDKTGTDDQRYVTRDDHNAARKWFEGNKRTEKRRQSKNNLRRLREGIENVTEGK